MPSTVWPLVETDKSLVANLEQLRDLCGELAASKLLRDPGVSLPIFFIPDLLRIQQVSQALAFYYKRRGGPDA